MKAEKIAGLALLALLVTGTALLINLPCSKPGGTETPVKGDRTGAGHGSGKTPPPLADTGCGQCHKGLPHVKNANTRAFLNLHVSTMACHTCHAERSGLVPSREGGAKTGLIKLNHPGGGPVGAPEVRGPVHAYPGGTKFQARGPSCGACHARNSSFLASPGLFDDYTRRLLEDLDVLPHLEKDR